MKAALMTGVGCVDVLQLDNIDEPMLTADNQVKVKINAAGVNPIDTKIRSRGSFFAHPLPIVLGCDGAGEIVEVGKAVQRYRVGDEVWFCHGGLGQEQGCYAEYSVLDSRWLSLKPHTMDFNHAAAVPLALITAWSALFDKAKLQAGETVLIHAGAGGVGHIAIQLAKRRGARVITTVSTVEKSAFVRTLGADHVILYPEQAVVAAVHELTQGQGADVVFDTVGGEVFKESIMETAYYGRLITLLDPGRVSLAEARSKNLLLGFELMLTPLLKELTSQRIQQIAMLDQAAHWIDQAQLRVEISQVLPLEQVKLAHEILQQGHVQGKIVLAV